jgi:hypothetical protein
VPSLIFIENGLVVFIIIEITIALVGVEVMALQTIRHW